MHIYIICINSHTFKIKFLVAPCSYLCKILAIIKRILQFNVIVVAILKMRLQSSAQERHYRARIR